MDAFYQCFDNLAATESVLKSFFGSNRGRVWIVSDGGADFSPMLKQFGDSVFYDHSEINTKQNFHRLELCIEWLRRLRWAAGESSASRLILLEDDVWIRGNLEDIPQTAPIMGPPYGDPTWGNDIPEACRTFINRLSKRRDEYKYYGGCGGCIFDRALFLESHDFAVQVFSTHWDELKRVSMRCHGTRCRWAHADFVLTLLFNLSGYAYGGNPEHTECHKHVDWKTNGRRVVHGYKALYPKAASRRRSVAEFRQLG